MFVLPHMCSLGSAFSWSRVLYCSPAKGLQLLTHWSLESPGWLTLTTNRKGSQFRVVSSHLTRVAKMRTSNSLLQKITCAYMSTWL
ncbi:hypothetical protein XELAEV_18001140mg [Xenopus laevis]|nr:hypothetical protein XELAEV_18001140mg [Xenopus laevis]